MQPAAASIDPVVAYATPPSASAVARCPPGIMAMIVARRRPTSLAFWLAVFQFLPNVAEDGRPLLRVQLLIHTPERHAHDITMMQLAAKIVTEFEPQLVHQIDIF